jgi:hypothetical protein
VYMAAITGAFPVHDERNTGLIRRLAGQPLTTSCASMTNESVRHMRAVPDARFTLIASLGMNAVQNNPADVIP